MSYRIVNLPDLFRGTAFDRESIKKLAILYGLTADNFGASSIVLFGEERTIEEFLQTFQDVEILGDDDDDCI